jgi:hypothetical protein
VRDVTNNLVKNAGVNFTITADPSGGSLGAARAITDVTGSASVTYVGGSVSSPQNGVKFTATVTDISGNPVAPVSGTAALTVSGQSLLVRLGTDNLVQSLPPLNKKTWVATVNTTATTDASGVATAVITYAKDHATWTEVILEARTGVAGNDPPTTATFFLPGLASDYADINVSPPGQISPYGQSPSCANTL